MANERLQLLAFPKNYVCLEHFFRGSHVKNVIGTEWHYYKISTLIVLTNLNTIKLTVFGFYVYLAFILIWHVACMSLNQF